MRARIVFGIVLFTALMSNNLFAQRNPKKEEAFVKAPPAVGDLLPEVAVFHPDGSSFRTSELHGHYAVITFGCLT